MSGSRGTSSLAALLSLALAAAAQERLEVQGPEPALVRLGEAARVQLCIHDPGGSLRDIVLPQVEGMSLRLQGPSQRESIVSVNGRVQRGLQVFYQVEVLPLREGTFVLPPFAVWTGSREQRTAELRVEARRDVRAEQLAWIDVSTPTLRVYEQEPVRIHVEAGVLPTVRLVRGRASNRQPYADVEVQATWLEPMAGVESIAVPDPAGNTALIVRGGNNLMVVGHDPSFVRDGTSWLRFTFDRALLPTKPGRLELAAPTFRFHVLRSESRDVFGLQRGGLSENFFVYGKPIVVDVLPIPEAGRPSPWYGAVGRFTLAATVDRDRVKVGNSIKLTLTVRGQGNFEFLRLPELDALPGFHELGKTAIERAPDRATITYDLTPKSADVQAVPAIAWSFFDTTPGVERFVTVSTEPLPLVVQPPAVGETLAPLPESNAAPVIAGVDDVFDLPDLVGPAVRLERPGTLGPWLAVLAPWLLLMGSSFLFRWLARRRGDGLGGRARVAARACERALAAGADPLAALTDYLGDRLGVSGAALIAADAGERLQQAGVAPELAARLVAAIEQGTAARYGGGAGLAAVTVRELVAALEVVRFGVARLLPLWLLPLFLTLAASGPLQAQDDPAAVAVAAYRAKDYAAAEAGFAKAFATTGDRRLLRARGNCFVRMQSPDLPRALWCYECARLGLPRDAELAGNVRFVRQRLELSDAPDGMVAAFVRALHRLTADEQLWVCGTCMTLAAALLLLGWRRPAARTLGFLCGAAGAVFAVELLWLAPNRPPVAIALERLELRAEPRADLPSLATVRPGVAVGVQGSQGGSWLRVAIGDRIGYVPASTLAVVE
ncbi:MAG: hypothetical protein ACK501_21910 [Planctomycetota bacterium]